MKIFVILLVTLLSVITEAKAQRFLGSFCASHQMLTNHLFRKYGEVPAAVSITNGGHLVERYESPKTKTWTIFVTNPLTRISCLIMAGSNWQEKLMEEPGYEH